jgi:hypothetical protein
MKINPNDPAYPVVGAESADEDYPGMPIRLAIAAQMMAPVNAVAISDSDPSIEARRALAWADALIAAYNESAP